MIEGGYIKLYRKMTKWEWYQNANTFRVFLHLLLTANYESNRFEGRIIERGQRVASISGLSKELNLSERAIRTALQHLKTTHEVTVLTCAKFSIITIKKYDFYQEVTGETPNKGQATDKQATSERQQWKKEKESIRKIKKRERSTLLPRGQFLNVFLSDEEIADLGKKYPKDYQQKLDRLSRYIESNGKHYPNHYIKLLDWLEEDKEKSNSYSPGGTIHRNYDIEELEQINTLDYVD